MNSPYFALVILAFSALFLVSIPRTASAQWIVAHRGASADAPENTMAAFEEAWRQQADAIEGDFYLTRDFHIVCIHDADTERTGGKNLSVENSTLRELRTLEYGGWKAEKFQGEPLPTIQQILDSLPAEKKFVIELKSDARIVPHLAEVLEDYISDARIAAEQLLIISFDEACIAACQRKLPKLRAHWLTGFKPTAEGGFRPSAEEISVIVKSCQADGVGLNGNRDAIDAGFSNELYKHGISEFHVWTVDSPSDARFFQDLGAVGITTNKPALIRKALSSSLETAPGTTAESNSETR